jgi:hypothetical protein
MTVLWEERARRWRARLAATADLPPVNQAWKGGPCEMTLPAKPRSNGRVLLVRCRCLGRYAEPLGEAGSLPEARALWDEHCASRTARDSHAVAS